MNKYKNKYRIPSTRLQQWDYRWAGAYFITICTQNRKHYFGEIVDGAMQLSHTGVIADILWHQIPQHARNADLGAFVVMPNHIHGILIITKNTNNNDIGVGNAGTVETGQAVETGHALSLQSSNESSNKIQSGGKPIQTIGQQRFQHIGNNSISSIVGSYKSAVTRHARRLAFTFEWQTRFYDHIIRDEKSFQTISDYIQNNPLRWQEDKFYKSE